MPSTPKLNRTNRSILRLLLESDNGSMYGHKIARATPLWWRFPLSTGAAARRLRRLERCGWVASRWESHRADGGRLRRLYSINPKARDHIIDQLGLKLVSVDLDVNAYYSLWRTIGLPEGDWELRIGGKIGCNLYLTWPDGRSEPVGQVPSAALAAFIVKAVNHYRAQQQKEDTPGQ